MKINYKQGRLTARRPWGARRRTPSGPVLKQIRELKLNLYREFLDAAAGNEKLLGQALNEAEALAWQTSLPQLFFPSLAREKAQEVGRWAFRQRAIRQAGPLRAFAA